MVSSIKYKLPFLLFFISFGLSFGQNYPIKATLQVTPPYSAYLLDYADIGNEKLRVLLTLNDINISNYTIKLHFSIEGNGYSINTHPHFLASPISLQGGVPELLGAYELSSYFDLQNLQFTGLSSQTYQKNKSLPEGYYTLSVTAYDYSSAQPKQISNTSTVAAWFALSDPPLPIFPACGQTISSSDGSQIVFQWLNQSISPYGQQNTEYELELFEVRPDTKNPNDAIQSSYPVFSTTVEQNLFIYGPTEIPLIKGMLYVWRVRAKDKNGRLAYKNNGNSSVCTFRYGSKYSYLENQAQLTLSVIAKTHRMAIATWDTLTPYTSYTLSCKKANSNANWREVQLNESRKKICDLAPNTTYIAKVKGHVEDYTSPESNTVTFTTPDIPTYTCSSSGEIELDSAEFKVPLLKQAHPDMIIRVGAFEMQITQVSGSNGIFSGKGIMLKSLFGFSILAQFTNITINENQVMLDGEVNSISKANSSMLVNVDALWENIQALANQLSDLLDKGDIPAANNMVDSILKHYPDKERLSELIISGTDSKICGNNCDSTNKFNQAAPLDSLGKQGGKGGAYFFVPATTNCAPCYSAFLLAVSNPDARIETQTNIVELLAQLKNAHSKNTAVSLEGVRTYLSGSYLRINGINYDNIYIKVINQATAVSPNKNITLSTYDLGGIKTACIDVQNKVKIFVKTPEKLSVLKSYLTDLATGSNLLLFVNGYRSNDPNPIEKPNTTNSIYFEDALDYWDIINNQFIDRLKPNTVVYADGHHSVTTSNHFSEATFAQRYLAAKNVCAEMLPAVSSGTPGSANMMVSNSCYHKAACMQLSTKPNKGGFNQRLVNGATAGKLMADKITSGKIVFNPATDVVDIVCHSMGFAYAQGMIAELQKAKIKMGRYYIIAPENASSGSVTLNKFEEVWQYGSDAVNDSIWEQDGIAPQTAVFGLPENNRVYIPAQNQVNFVKEFTNCHRIKNYGWIFTITSGKGYVKKR